MFLSQDSHPELQRLVILLTAIVSAIAIHGTMLWYGTYEGTYDSYVHIFFAKHYASHWWNTWVYQWFDGFDLASYPPLVHQLIAMVSHVTGLGNAYVLVQLVAYSVLIMGVFRFSRIWFDEVPSAFAGCSVIFLTSYAQAVHHFGQLPSCFAIGFALNAAYYFMKWICANDVLGFVSAICYMLVVLTSHHLTFFLFAPLLLATLSIYAYQFNSVDQNNRRNLAIRVFVFALCLGVVGFLLLQPFIQFVRVKMPIQVEIPHATRQSYFSNLEVFITFFAVPVASVGVFLFTMPFIAIANRQLRSLSIAVFILILFGLGGTTPIPHLVFGKMWGVFTYDRFLLWATILALPFVAFCFR